MLLQHFIRIRICILYLHSHSAFANSSARKFNILLAKDSLLFICLAISAQLDFEFDVDFPFFLEFFWLFWNFVWSFDDAMSAFVFQCHKLCRRCTIKISWLSHRHTHILAHIQAHTLESLACCNITHTPCGQLFWVGGFLALIFVHICECVCVCCCCCCLLLCCMLLLWGLLCIIFLYLMAFLAWFICWHACDRRRQRRRRAINTRPQSPVPHRPTAQPPPPTHHHPTDPHITAI